MLATQQEDLFPAFLLSYSSFYSLRLIKDWEDRADREVRTGLKTEGFTAVGVGDGGRGGSQRDTHIYIYASAVVEFQFQEL